MVFSSALFLFAFLPVFLVAYYATPARFRSALIVVFSYSFYGWWRPDFLGLLAGVTAGTYLLALALDAATDERVRARWLAFGVTANLLALAYFKYANFGVDSLNALLAAMELPPLAMAHVLLPIGLSFYIFHAISYLVDIYRGEAPPARNIVDFAAFIALFPHLIAGPMLRYHLLAEQFAKREHSIERFSRGCVLFMVGFCKKVLVADAIAPIADAAFALDSPTMADAWLGAISYGLQLFFDFSGYTDMAIGLAWMIGFEFPQNFNDPYLATSITDFWRRWHMSLSGWLRRYLYVPLGGNRKGRARTYANLFATMVLGGLWHGANWTFVLWGALHGAVLAAERYAEERAPALRWPVWLAAARTLLVVLIGWVLFRAADLRGAGAMFGGMAGVNGIGISPAVDWQLTVDRIAAMGIAVALVLAMPWLRRNEGGALRYLLVPLFVWAVATLAAQSFKPFLYFQF
jgi:alginate O-acetyltransferase complex protein AlgI